MQLEIWQIFGGIATTALITWGGMWKTAQNNKAAVSAQLQTGQEKLEESLRVWQDAQVKQERTWRLEAENDRMKESKECDQRIEVLRMRYDELRDKYDKLAEKYSDQRIVVHDLRNELAVFRLKSELGPAASSAPA